MVVGNQVDVDNHRTLLEMLNNADGVPEGMLLRLPNKVVDREAMADTGATVVCGGTGLMPDMGLKLEQLLQQT